MRQTYRLLCLVVVIGALASDVALPPSTTPVHAQSDTLPLPVAAFGARPRLLITQAYVQQTLQPRAARNVPPWASFLAYVQSDAPEDNARWSPGTALRALALAWLVTGQPPYAERAKAVMVELVNRVEMHPALQGTGGFDGALFDDVAALALGYDWMHSALTGEDRQALRTTLWRALSRLRDPAADLDGLIWLDGEIMAWGNHTARWLWALTAGGLALWGEHEGAPGLLAFCRKTFADIILPALDLQTGGAWAEGPVYGFLAGWAFAQTALAWWTAAGENYFDDTPWWYDRLAYDLFLYHPGIARTYNADWGDPMHSYPSIIGDAERYHPAAAYGRAQDLLLRTVFAGSEHARWMDWFLRQSPDNSPDWMSAEEFLWRDPDSSGLSPDVNTWFAPYLGHVFMRSAWLNGAGQYDRAATYVSFNAGDRLAYHQFYDQGNFTLYHNGQELIVRSGVYSGDGTSDHDANYYARTIAANTVLICDLAENFDGIRPNAEREVWLNDCGQRTMSPHPRTAVNLPYLLANWRAYDTGSVIRFAQPDGITYLRADLTGAYNSTFYSTPENRPKVSAVLREFVYWRPATLFVYDRVVTTYPAYTPLTVFHFQSEPQPQGAFFRSQVGESAVYAQNLRPYSQVSVVQGYQVAGQGVDRSWGEPASNDFEREPYGLYRLEIAPGAPNLDHWFLTVFVAQDAADPPPTPGTLVLGEGVRGAALGTAQVMFDAAPEDGADVRQATFEAVPGVTQVLVTGLVPQAQYTVTGAGTLARTETADEAGTLVIVGPLPGLVTLRRSGG
ncbi:MAG: heparinase II/III domain-containing protein [Aggregatilineaceae bacterium]